MPNLLSAKNLKVSLKNPSNSQLGFVLKGVDFHIDEGERVALVGESGCGKSITALSVLHLLPQPPMEIEEGEIRFKDVDLEGFSEAQWRSIRGKEIGIVFQDPIMSLNPVMPVGEQIEEVIHVHLDISIGDARQKALKLLAEVGLPDPERIARQYPHQLSGGMCQRIMIAMAIACEPVLLIADEPTTALDVTVQSQILELLSEMTERYKLAILLITHDLRIVREHADRVIILYAGLVVEEGKPSDLYDHPQHPYTEGLLASLPEFSNKGKPLLSIGGVVPLPFEEIIGCSFANRCSRVSDKCRLEKPSLNEIKKGHQVRCFYPSKK